MIDRVGGPVGRNNAKDHHRDEIQARIDSIVNNATEQNMMMPPGFPPMMDMNVAANMANPLLMQEMMMNQMVLMAQMATSMGIINPATGQFAGPDYPMQQGAMPNDMGLFPAPAHNGFPKQVNQNNTANAGRGRGGMRGGRGTGRGRGSSVATGQSGPSTSTHTATFTEVQEGALPVPAVVPVPVAPTPVIAAPPPATPPLLAYAVPERPQSPTLCKFGLKCTNAHCRYSHPSPVATVESGIVLSNDPCEKGKDCKDKDCVKAHVSPAALNPDSKHLHCYCCPCA